MAGIGGGDAGKYQFGQGSLLETWQVESRTRQSWGAQTLCSDRLRGGRPPVSHTSQHAGRGKFSLIDNHHCELLPNTPSFKPWPAYWKTQTPLAFYILSPRRLHHKLEATQTRLGLQTLGSLGRFGVLLMGVWGILVIMLLSRFNALALSSSFIPSPLMVAWVMPQARRQAQGHKAKGQT